MIDYNGKTYTKIAGHWAHPANLHAVGFWLNRKLNKLARQSGME